MGSVNIDLHPPPVRDERHDEAQHCAHDDGRGLAEFHVHADEHEALDRQNRRGHYREFWMPVEGAGDDQSNHADEFDDAERHPGLPWQRTKRGNVSAHSVKQEDFHHARRSVQERGENPQDPQQYVHRELVSSPRCGRACRRGRSRPCRCSSQCHRRKRIGYLLK